MNSSVVRPADSPGAQHHQAGKIQHDAGEPAGANDLTGGHEQERDEQRQARNDRA